MYKIKSLDKTSFLILSDLEFFTLFPGPLQVVCEDKDIQSVDQLCEAVKDSKYGRKSVRFLLRWINDGNNMVK